MCILCDIYNKHPNARCGNMSIKVLKDKILAINGDEGAKGLKEPFQKKISDNLFFSSLNESQPVTCSYYPLIASEWSEL